MQNFLICNLLECWGKQAQTTRASGRHQASDQKYFIYYRTLGLFSLKNLALGTRSVKHLRSISFSKLRENCFSI